MIVAPSVELKEPWVEKLRTRFKETGLEKDRLALLNAEASYEENIKDILSYSQDFLCFEITAMSYNLRDMFDNFVKDNKVLETFGFKRSGVLK